MGISPAYFLDEMSSYELDTLFEYRYYRHKESWEQARMCTHATVQVNNSKSLSHKDICIFPWEIDIEESESIESVDWDNIRKIKQKLIAERNEQQHGH